MANVSNIETSPTIDNDPRSLIEMSGTMLTTYAISPSQDEAIETALGQASAYCAYYSQDFETISAPILMPVQSSRFYQNFDYTSHFTDSILEYERHEENLLWGARIGFICEPSVWRR